MKLLIATGIFPPDIGGPATYSRILAEELVKRGHEVRLLCYSSRKIRDNYSFPVTRVLRSSFKPWHYLKYFLAAKKLAKWSDLVYAQDPVSAGWPAMVAAKIHKKPFAVKVTGDYSWEQAMGRGYTDKLIDDFQKTETFPASIGKIRGVQIHVCKSADLVVVPAEYLKNLAAGWGMYEDRIKIVHNSVEVEKLDISKERARTELGIDSSAFLVVSAGRAVPWKGFELLKSVAEDLKRKIPNIKLEILSSAPHASLLKHLKAADVFALNTGYEGFPHVVWEAMSLGTPVVTTRVCGNPEIIEDGLTGLLVGYNNRGELSGAIEKLHNDSVLAENISSKAKEAVQKSTVKGMIDKTEDILIKLALGSEPGRKK